MDCPGYAEIDKVAPIVIEAGDVSATWKFGEGSIIRGHVRDQSGAPVANASMTASGYPFSSTDTSKADGTYEIRGLAPSSYYVRAKADHSMSGTDLTPVEVGEKATVEHDVVVIADGAIAGVVVDHAGHPIANVKITVSCRNDYPGTITGNDGTFRFDDIPGDDADVTADLGIQSLRQKVVIHPNTTTDVRFVVDTGAAVLSGVVLDELGQPAADVVVTASREGVDHGWNPSRFETGRDGRFAFSSVPEGTYKLEAHRGGSPKAKLEHVPTGTLATLRFEPSSAIAGRVGDSDGNPLSNFEIVISSGDATIRRERFYKSGGRYHLDDLPAGKYDVAVTVNGSEGRVAVELGKGERRDNVDLAIDVSLVVTGRVVDLESHKPIAGIGVGVRMEGPGTGHGASTDVDGRFTVSGLAHGIVSIEVYDPLYTVSQFKRSIPSAHSIDIGDIMIVKRRYADKDGQTLGGLGLSVSDDLRIDGFDPNSSGAKAGLVVGDVITSIDGLDVTTAAGSVVHALTVAPIGTTIRVGVARGVTIAAVTTKF